MHRDKVSIVTGGTRGIGLAIVRHLAAQGAKVWSLDLEPAPAEAHDAANWRQGDVTQSDQVGAFLEEVVGSEGRIDILVNNAGIFRDSVIWRMDEEAFDEVIAVNLKGPWLMCRAVASHMRAREQGRIINIASRAWLGAAGQSNYSASKGGLISLTRVLALELAPKGITVNAVAPGLIDTPMTRSLPTAIFDRLVSGQPGKAPGQPEDVAAAVGFLASDDARFINGQVLYVDGGKSVAANLSL
ncbi:MAG: SDR family NAD(P)-dependent oxidoreductase [Candidatus Neomarinimicrobiota bacterium]